MAQLCSSTPGCAAFSVISPTYSGAQKSGKLMCEMHPETIAQSSQANQFWSVWQSDAPKAGKWPYAPGAEPQPPPPPPPHQELAWDTPSKDVTGSMPLGNGKLGLNVHADSSDTVWLLLSHIDALDENTNLDKLGRVAVRATTSTDAADAAQPFKQEMHLTNATVHIDLTSGVSLDVWVDATTDAVRVESSSPTPHKLEEASEFIEPFYDVDGDHGVVIALVEEHQLGSRRAPRVVLLGVTHINNAVIEGMHDKNGAADRSELCAVVQPR